MFISEMSLNSYSDEAAELTNSLKEVFLAMIQMQFIAAVDDDHFKLTSYGNEYHLLKFISDKFRHVEPSRN